MSAPTTSSPRGRRVVVLAVAVAAVLAVVAASCSDDSSTTTTTAGTTTSSRGSGNGFSVNTPAGEVSLSLDGDLPPNWPSTFPVPAGADVAGSGSLGKDDSSVMVGVYTTRKSGSDTFDFYRGESSLSPSDEKSTSVGSGFIGSMKISGRYDGSVTVAEVGGTTYIVAILTSGSATSTTSGTGSSASTTAGGATSTSAGA